MDWGPCKTSCAALQIGRLLRFVMFMIWRCARESFGNSHGELARPGCRVYLHM